MEIPWHVLPRRYRRLGPPAWQADTYYSAWQWWAEDYLARRDMRAVIPKQRRLLNRALAHFGDSLTERRELAAKIRWHAIDSVRAAFEENQRYSTGTILSAVPSARPAMKIR